MSKLTIDEVKDEKRKLEAFIAEQLVLFSESTGTAIDGIDIGTLETMDRKVLRYTVEVRASL